MRFRSLGFFVLAVAGLQGACSRSSATDGSSTTQGTEPHTAPSAPASGGTSDALAPSPATTSQDAALAPTPDVAKASVSDGSVGSPLAVAAPKVIHHRYEVEFPGRGVELAKRINAYNDPEGYLDIARSSDGTQLWVRRHWDDGSTDENHFTLEANGHDGLVLQFVDGVQVQSESDAMGRRSFKDSSGRTYVQALTAWPVDPAKGVAYDVEAHTWIPMIPAAGQGTASARKRVQWMIKVERCADANPCVYYGSPADVCGKYTASIPKAEEWMMWIAPTKCKGQW